MGVKSVQRYVNVEGGLLFETLFTEPLKMAGCVGKSVKVEQAEMDTLIIDGEYYEIIGWYNGLAHIKKMEQEEREVPGRKLVLTLKFLPEQNENLIDQVIVKAIARTGHIVAGWEWSDDLDNMFKEGEY